MIAALSHRRRGHAKTLSEVLSGVTMQIVRTINRRFRHHDSAALSLSPLEIRARMRAHR
jgi:hypothetical protein